MARKLIFPVRRESGNKVHPMSTEEADKSPHTHPSGCGTTKDCPLVSPDAADGNCRRGYWFWRRWKYIRKHCSRYGFVDLATKWVRITCFVCPCLVCLACEYLVNRCHICTRKIVSGVILHAFSYLFGSKESAIFLQSIEILVLIVFSVSVIWWG